MKLETRYIMAGIVLSIGCLIWYRSTELYPIAMLFIYASESFVTKTKWNEPIKFGIPKWDVRGFFLNISRLLLTALLIIIWLRLKGQLMELFSTWYFTGLFWLCCLFGLMTRFVEEKRKAQPLHSPDVL